MCRPSVQRLPITSCVQLWLHMSSYLHTCCNNTLTVFSLKETQWQDFIEVVVVIVPNEPVSNDRSQQCNYTSRTISSFRGTKRVETCTDYNQEETPLKGPLTHLKLITPRHKLCELCLSMVPQQSGNSLLRCVPT